MTSATDPTKEKDDLIFDISRYDMYGDDEKYTRNHVRFRLHNGSPVKIGDGSFGSVYLGDLLGGRGGEVAIKVFYNNNAIRHRQLSDISKEEMEKYFRRLEEYNPKFKEKILSHPPVKSIITNTKESDFNLFHQVHNFLSKQSKNSDQLETLNLLVNFFETLTTFVMSAGITRFQNERDYMVTLKNRGRSEDPNQMDRTIAGLVNVIGGTENFLSSLNKKEFAPLKKYFINESIDVSNYVLVMDRYNYSLKDLLERPLNSLPAQKKRSGIKDDHKTGYEILKELSHAYRAREGVFILENVVEGLKNLHTLGNEKPLLHLDIKPGNIFIKLGVQKKYQADLGDLGDLPEISGKDPMSLDSGGTIDVEFAPGTQHYRSPEQKYYKDVANVEIKHFEKNELKKNIKAYLDSKGNSSQKDAKAKDNKNIVAVLIIQDPKFGNTIIEENDLIIISKDRDRIKRLILERLQFEDGTIAFVIDSQPGAVNSELTNTGGVLREDFKTQAEFYKRQHFRTDLFGIGATLFDILTVGHSSENFYESIRKFESSNTTVDDIVTRYETLQKGELEAEDPDLSQIFNPFRHPTDARERYPDSDIIKFILKCMLYKCGGTFYNDQRRTPNQAIVDLQLELEGLKAKYKTSEDGSMLIHRDFEIKDTLRDSMQFDQEIIRLQGYFSGSSTESSMDKYEESLNRLRYGAFYFRNIVDLMRFYLNEIPIPVAEIEEGSSPAQGQKTPFLVQLLPMFISFELEGQNKKELNLKIDSAPSWKTVESFEDDLLKNRLDQFMRSSTNPYTPNSLIGIGREVRLFPENGEEHKFSYKFRDASFSNHEPEVGDWITFDNQLAKILEIESSGVLTLSIVKTANNGSNNDGVRKLVDGYFFKVIDPLKYYLEIIAMYLLHLIFVNSPMTTTTRKRIDIKSLLHVLEVGPDKFIIQPDLIKEENKIKSILLNLLNLYMKLTLHDSEGSFYQDYHVKMSSNSSRGVLKNRFQPIKNIADKQLKSIMDLADENYDLGDYPSLMQNDQFIIKEDLISQIQELLENPFDIEMEIKRSGMVGWYEEELNLL